MTYLGDGISSDHDDFREEKGGPEEGEGEEATPSLPREGPEEESEETEEK